MPIKAIGFVDGNNFYHNARKNGLNYQQADFSEMIKYVCNKKDWEYKGFYYYNSIPDQRENKITYFKQLSYFDQVKNMDKNLDTIIRKLRYASDGEISNELAKRKETLGSLSLCEDCMVKIKPCCFDCVMKKSAREKGIDVKIAIDIVQKALADEYDACVLISGDSDFVPALQLIEERGKKAFSLFMRCRGYSWELRNNIEFHAIKNKDFTNFLPSD